MKKWNWQKSDWPKFKWEPVEINKAEERFLLGSGIVLGTLKHLGEEGREQLIVESMSREALTTSEIEGELLNRLSVQSSIQKQLGLKTDAQKIGPAEQGIAEMMVDLYRNFSDLLTDKMLFGWHQKMMLGRRDLIDVGRYRTCIEAMQVISGGTMGVPQVHFEAPPASQVRHEMKQFILWFNHTVPGGKRELPAITRSGIAHLYFETVHPFEDGNGRIGRAISEKAIAQSLGKPIFTSLATTILANQNAYYDALEKVNQTNEITSWLIWFAEISLKAQNESIKQIEFLIAKTKFLDRLKNQLNERQEKVILRMLKEGIEGFKGGMSAEKYNSIAKASSATITRDLVDLVEKGALTRVGELRHARYHLNLTYDHG